MAIGGQADAITASLAGVRSSQMSLREVFNHGVAALAAATQATLATDALEAAVLDRTTTKQRTFRRLDDAAMSELRED